MKYDIELKRDGKFWIADVPGVEFMSQGYTKEEAIENIKDVISIIEECSVDDFEVEVIKCSNCNNELLERKLSDIQIVFDAKEYIMSCKKCGKNFKIYC